MIDLPQANKTETKPYHTMSHALAAASVSTAICISSVLGVDTPPCEPFTFTPSGCSSELTLQYCDITTPERFSKDVIGELKLCHSGIVGVQLSKDPVVRSKLRTDGSPNIFFHSNQKKNFVVLIRKGDKWERAYLSDIPKELHGTRARCFAPVKKA